MHVRDKIIINNDIFLPPSTLQGAWGILVEGTNVEKRQALTQVTHVTVLRARDVPLKRFLNFLLTIIFYNNKQ